MKRLFDADKLKADLEKAISKNEDMDCLDFLRVASVIDAQPTAYDPDKVVEQLEELKKAEQNKPDNCDENGFGDGEQIFNDGRSQGRFEAFGEAIKIVKKVRCEDEEIDKMD